MYETKQYSGNLSGGESSVYHLQAKATQIPRSVSQNVDASMEAASKTRYFALQLRDELKQINGKEEILPVSGGMDGKLLDAENFSNQTLALLQEIRTYLVG